MILALVSLMQPAQSYVAKEDRGLVEQLRRCGRETDDALRLACFDRAAQTLSQLEAKGTRYTLAPTTDEERALKRGIVEGGVRVPTLTTTIASTTLGSTGRYNIALADGSLWQTVEPLRFVPKAGSAATVKAGALGAYTIRLSSGQLVKIKRLR